IVGLNSDSSIKRIKGNKRPINTLKDRLKVLSAIEYVDYIVVFNEDTPYKLIKSIKPDYLVKQQILIAQGFEMDIDQKFVDDFRGHAIEYRINAEDWERNFIPSVGTIETLEFPLGNGIRIDTHIYPGYKIPPFYDSMLAKLIVWGPNRNSAISRSKRALDEFKINGVKTVIGLHKHIVNDENFIRGRVYTKYLEEFIPRILNSK
ncbi:MAG: hypothetical protein N2446_01440, partial [Elusimicrobiales bacterium]|nr:hypothetical protein [Elusimicrobiales bacterium]